MQKILTCFFTFLCCSLFAQTEDNFKVLTHDVPAFWKAFDTFKADTTKNPFGLYLKNGSAGLQELRRYYICDSVAFKKNIQKNIAYYKQARTTTLDVDSIKSKSVPYFHKLKTIFPQATFPHVYMVVGCLNSHVTTIHDTILICVENFPSTELITADGRRSSVSAEIPMVLTRGIIFTNQKPAHTGWTLLRQCILHGTTEFILGLLDDSQKSRILNAENFIYGETHEEQLVKEFLVSKDGTEFKDWLYNESAATTRPRNLGQWIGYKIVESYYNNMADKSKAISDIMKINDFEKFLLLSGYAEPFRY